MAESQRPKIVSPAVAATARRQVPLRVQDAVVGYLFLLPAFTFLAVWWFWPMAYSVYLSFTSWDFMSPEKDWVGLNNYRRIVTQSEFRRVLWNTIYFSVGTVGLSLVAGLGLAMLLNQKLRGLTFYRALMFSPWITPTVAAAIVCVWIYEPRVGLANWLLSVFGISPVEWLGSRQWAMPAVIFFSVWKGMGYNMVYFLAGLQSIPSSLYEAAEIDGATAWTRFRHVTLPLLSPMTFFLLVVSLIGAFNAFDQIRVMTRGGPAGSTRTILYYLYQAGFEGFEMGYASAVAIVLLLMILALTLIQFRLSRAWVHYD
jgi:multiple sugar transport system permease protein